MFFLFLVPAAKLAHLLVLSVTDNDAYLYTIQYVQYLKRCFMDYARGLILEVQHSEADPLTSFLQKMDAKYARAP